MSIIQRRIRFERRRLKVQVGKPFRMEMKYDSSLEGDVVFSWPDGWELFPKTLTVPAGVAATVGKEFIIQGPPHAEIQLTCVLGGASDSCLLEVMP